jgi:hypothetical protein
MDYFVLEKATKSNKLNESFIIKENKKKNYIKNKEIFSDYIRLRKLTKKTDMFNKLIYKFPSHIIINLLDISNIIQLELSVSGSDIYYRNYDNTIDYSKRKLHKYKTGKYRNITATYVPDIIYEKIKNWDKDKIEQFFLNYNLLKLVSIYDILEINGNYIFEITNYYNDKTIDFLYLLFTLFDSIVIFAGRYILCNNFNPVITKDKLKSFIGMNGFIIEPKDKLNDLIQYLNNSFLFTNKILQYLINSQYDELDNIYYKEYIKYINKISNSLNKSVELTNILLEFNHFYVSKLKKSYDNNSNILVRIKAGIGEEEGKYLRKILKNKNIKKCMEIGLAMGISTLNILSSIYKRNGTLLSIDPNQSTKWNNMGKKLIANSQLEKYHDIIEDKSYFVMPKLLDKYKQKLVYDFIFIDGWHTFDYTLIDFFYADKLLKIGGIIVVDDALHQGVKKTLKYIDTNYNDYYKKLESPKTFGAYKKIKDDTRSWDFHKEF